MKKLKRLLTMLLCVSMLMPSVIAAQANESDSLTVKPATTGTITDYVVTKTVYDENGNELEEEIEIELRITFDECYGILEYTTDIYDGVMPFPIVREGSKMHVEVIRNGEYIENPHLLENRHCFNLCYDFETDDFGDVMWREDLDDNVDKSKDLVKEGENKYCYTMYNGVNHYFMGSERFVFGDPWDQIILATVLAVNDEQIKQMKETGVMTFSVNEENEYTCAWPGVYGWLFGEEPPAYTPVDIKFYKYIAKSQNEMQLLCRFSNNNDTPCTTAFIFVPMNNYEYAGGYQGVKQHFAPNSEKIGVFDINVDTGNIEFNVYDDDSHIEVPEDNFIGSKTVNECGIIWGDDEAAFNKWKKELNNHHVYPLGSGHSLTAEESEIATNYLREIFKEGANDTK